MEQDAWAVVVGLTVFCLFIFGMAWLASRDIAEPKPKTGWDRYVVALRDPPDPDDGETVYGPLKLVEKDAEPPKLDPDDDYKTFDGQTRHGDRR